MPTTTTLKEVEEKIRKVPLEEQRYFLIRLPQILSIEEKDWAGLKTQESSFDFWDNPYDERYNNL